MNMIKRMDRRLFGNDLKRIIAPACALGILFTYMCVACMKDINDTLAIEGATCDSRFTLSFVRILSKYGMLVLIAVIVIAGVQNHANKHNVQEFIMTLPLKKKDLFINKNVSGVIAFTIPYVLFVSFVYIIQNIYTPKVLCKNVFSVYYDAIAVSENKMTVAMILIMLWLYMFVVYCLAQIVMKLINNEYISMWATFLLITCPRIIYTLCNGEFDSSTGFENAIVRIFSGKIGTLNLDAYECENGIFFALSDNYKIEIIVMLVIAIMMYILCRRIVLSKDIVGENSLFDNKIVKGAFYGIAGLFCVFSALCMGMFSGVVGIIYVIVLSVLFFAVHVKVCNKAEGVAQ